MRLSHVNCSGVNSYFCFCVFRVARQVQTDQNVSTENLQVEMRELNKHLEAMEQRGVELERNLRDCKNGSPNRS